MSRSRNIKPGFFQNDQLAECDPLARILFAGLWCEADREGRLEDRPKKIKAACLPYDSCDCDSLLNQLAAGGFIVRYVVDGKGIIQVAEFAKHQNPHVKEAASSLPAPEKPGACTVQAEEIPERAGLIPSLLIPDSPTPSKQDQKTLRPSLREDADKELAELLADIPADLLRDYKKVRKAKKKALTARAIRGLIEAGRKGGKSLREVLEICCAESWVGYNHTWPRANARDAPVGGTGMVRADSPPQPNGKTVSAIIALEELKHGG
jgi:hypothetical protein